MCNASASKHDKYIDRIEKNDHILESGGGGHHGTINFISSPF